MNRKYIFGVVVTLSLLLSGCGNKSIVDKKEISFDTGSVNSSISINKELSSFNLKDQFENNVTLTNKIQKIIFVSSKSAGHLVKEFLDVQTKDYLTSKNAIYVADISGVPSIIASMFVLPGMKKSSYSTTVIQDEKDASMFINVANKESVMVISLASKIVTNVKFVTNNKDLKNAVE